MNRIASAFQNGKAFVAFVTGGDPSLAKTREFVLAMADAGADLIEIGVPFSDPIAEGPVIQEANLRALAAGSCTLDDLFELVSSLRKDGLETPLVFLTYANPVFRYGYEAFFARAKETGLDGLIIPDIPFEEQGELKPFAKAQGIDLITLIAPTSEERVLALAAEADGFVYLVSSMGVTGVRKEITTDLAAIIEKIKAATGAPVCVGFGVHSPEQAREIAKTADGVIVGSAIVKIAEEFGEAAAPHIADYVRKMKEAVKNA